MKQLSLKHLPIRIKLLFSHGLIAIMSLVIIIACVFGMRSIESKIEDLYNGPMTSLDYMGDLQYGTADLQRTIVWSIQQGNRRSYSEFETEVNQNLDRMYTALEKLEASATSKEDKDYLAQIRSLAQESSAYRTEVMEHLENGRTPLALNAYMTYRDYLNEIKNIADTMNDNLREEGAVFHEEAIVLSNTLIVIAVVLTILALFAVAVLVTSITKMIATPVQQIKFASERMNQGDLSVAHTITYEAEDELGQLADSMRDTLVTLDGYVSEISDTLQVIAQGDLTKPGSEITDFRGQFSSIKDSLLYILKRFNSTLTDIHHAADQVNSGSEQISSGAQTLASGAAEQASSVEELSATVTDISVQVNHTAENATSTMKQVDDTGMKVQTCNEQMKLLMTSMDDITQKSSEISKIVKTIEDIAFQTNILALNAAVEAARAGSAGKGFAVVADEVRNLAQKSAEASKTTSDLIGGTVDAVAKGTKVARETAGTLNQVVEGTHMITKLVDEIADDANREADALAQVTAGLDQISSVVQTTSATAEESAAASEELSGQSSMLKELINRFTLFAGTKGNMTSVASSSFHSAPSYTSCSGSDYSGSKY